MWQNATVAPVGRGGCAGLKGAIGGRYDANVMWQNATVVRRWEGRAREGGRMGGMGARRAAGVTARSCGKMPQWRLPGRMREDKRDLAHCRTRTYSNRAGYTYQGWRGYLWGWGAIPKKNLPPPRTRTEKPQLNRAHRSLRQICYS